MQWVKLVLLWVMAAFYVVAGTTHFTAADFYLWIMPDYLPFHLQLVYFSGLCEILLGLFLLLPATTRLAAWGVIALLIAVFPANIHMLVRNIPLRPGTPASPLALWLRLPVQGLLIIWAWWYTRPTDG